MSTEPSHHRPESSDGPAKARVLLADDHGIVRSGLRMLIERQSDMDVVA